ncbi:MAG: methyltransferase domain-containing protein, partial [Polyangiales bacterium]
TMSALAQTLTHNFKSQNRDVAVLRLDGVNNLGESEKDPGLHKDGRQTMHYTVSDGVSDVLGALAWGRNNPYFEATETIIVSVSFSSVPVRVALTRPEASCVARWIVYMGAADVQNCIMNVAGNYDAWGRYVRGMPNGVVTLQGCMVDGDRFCADADRLAAATLDDARRDMMKIPVPVTWMVGSYDAWMDPGRIHDIMSANAAAEREILKVDTGHTPSSSDEALAQFQLITQRVWSQLYGENIDAVVPPRGLVAAVANQEWARIRQQESVPREEYWRSYLQSDEKHGYNLLRHLPAYREFATVQASDANPAGRDVLDLGAGTGIVSNALLEMKPARLTCLDIVEPALERLRAEFADNEEVELIRADADGNPRTAMRRWLSGELGSVHDLVGRIPGVTQPFADAIAARMNEDLRALLRGADLNAEAVRKGAGLEDVTGPLLADLNTLAKAENGTLSVSTAIQSLKRVPASVFEHGAGLPFADASYDAVVSSLVLSYLKYPADCLSECWRVLKPGGRLVVSSMKPDADTSVIYREFLDTIDATPDAELSADREEILQSARALLNKAAELLRHEKEGKFSFFDSEQLSSLVRRAGFSHVRIRQAYGTPPQAIVVSCRKPEILK